MEQQKPNHTDRHRPDYYKDYNGGKDRHRPGYWAEYYKRKKAAKEQEKAADQHARDCGWHKAKSYIHAIRAQQAETVSAKRRERKTSN